MTADANKAESLVCMDRAREAIRNGDLPKAERMLQKAKKLDPSQDISYLLKKVQMMGTSHNSTDSTDRSYAHDDHYDEQNLRNRKPKRGDNSQDNASNDTNERASSRKSSPSKGSAMNERRDRSKSSERKQMGVNYTKDEVALVERIRHCKDYYEILNVPKTAPEVQIKKEYRKMALQLHPDKCRAPHATEAFKALGNAYAVLSDKDKRAQYDAYGVEGTTERRRGDYFEYDYGRGFEADITPEEIFNMFFGGGYPDGTFSRRRHHFHHQHETHEARNESSFAPLLQLAPLLLILLLGLITQFMVGDPPYSLNQNSKYNVRRETTELKIAYFVKKDFEQQYGGRVNQVEQQVEDEYVNILRMNCYKEQNQKETMKYRARLYHDQDLFRRAEAMEMPNCNRLKQVYSH